MSPILPRETTEADRQSSQLVRISGMGTELAGSIIGMTLLGYLIDHFAGTLPWGVIGGAVVGILGGGYNFLRHATKISRDAAADFKKRHPHGVDPPKPIIPPAAPMTFSKEGAEEADPWDEKWDKWEKKWDDKPDGGDQPGYKGDADDRR